MSVLKVEGDFIQIKFAQFPVMRFYVDVYYIIFREARELINFEIDQPKMETETE